MTPRQQADRLYDRTMIAAEQGDSVQARQFASKAVSAYGMLDALDADARYHLSLVHAVNGNALAGDLQADSIEATAPRHLFVSLIRVRNAIAAGDTGEVLLGYRRFLENYDREMAAQRSEYEVHRATIESFRDQARRAAGSTP